MTDSTDFVTQASLRGSTLGSQKTADPLTLLGVRNQDVLDTEFWGETTANGGTTSVANGIVNLSTNTTADGSVELESNSEALYDAVTANSLLMWVRLGDTGTADNIRRWGIFNSTDGLFFELNGTTLNIVYRIASSDTTVASSSFNGDSAFALDTELHLYEIHYNFGEAVFIQDGQRVHTVKPTATSVSGGSFNLPIRLENTNSSSSTTDVDLYVGDAAVHRFGYGTGQIFQGVPLDPSLCVREYDRQVINSLPVTMVTYTVPDNKSLLIGDWVFYIDNGIGLGLLRVDGVELDSVRFGSSDDAAKLQTMAFSCPLRADAGSVVTILAADDGGDTGKEYMTSFNGTLVNG